LSFLEGRALAEDLIRRHAVAHASDQALQALVLAGVPEVQVALQRDDQA
jgi:hypothetical protein